MVIWFHMHKFGFLRMGQANEAMTIPYAPPKSTDTPMVCLSWKCPNNLWASLRVAAVICGLLCMCKRFTDFLSMNEFARGMWAFFQCTRALWPFVGMPVL